MKFPFQRTIFIPFLILAGLVVCALILSFQVPIQKAFRFVFGLFYLLFLPGFVWSFVLFRKDHIDFIERIGLSLCLSLVTIPMILILLNIAGIKITLLSIILEVAGFIVSGFLLWIWFVVRSQRRKTLSRHEH